MDLVWYVAYGSNIARERFRCYVEGGRPTGGSRTYPGCQDPSPPVAEASVEFPGRLVFGGRSRVWGGGLALYDATGAGVVAGRAYQVTTEQFADIAAQEMWSPPGGEFATVVAESLPTMETMHAVGAGTYETVYRIGDHDGRPLLTITNDDVTSRPLAPPAPAYLWWIGTGLRESHGWTARRVGEYLAAAPGATGAWSIAEVVQVLGRPAPSAVS